MGPTEGKHSVRPRFGVLGPLWVVGKGGTPVRIAAAKVRALLSRLLLDAGATVSVDQILESLYPQGAPSEARNALQAHVSRLRRALAPADVTVTFDPTGGYRLEIEADEVDCHRFTTLLEAGAHAVGEDLLQEAVPLLSEGVELWRGPALPELEAAASVQGRISWLENSRLEAIEELARAELAVGSGARSIPRLWSVIAEHPLRERARTALVRALTAQDRTGEALAVFEEGRLLLAEELGADPSPELTQAHLDALSRMDQGNGPDRLTDDRTSRPRPRPIPLPHSRFIGREGDLSHLTDLLHANRLVTLTGPGGAGKTRLALEAARTADGDVCFVELADTTDGEDIARAVTTTLGVGDGDPELSPISRLTEALSDRPLLVVLDNCEHVVTVAARLATRLLSSCPHLRLLATSRESLAVDGEAVADVPPLESPVDGSDPACAGEAPAVALFVDRAAQAGCDLGDEPAHLHHIARICRELDGLPLAIELAAARTRSLSVGDIADRLTHHRFTLLSRGDRTTQARLRGLREVVQWSWDLLDTGEQTAARRMAVFAGDASLAAVEHVCGTDVERVAGLVDKSLVLARDGGYAMLETVRAFAAERLAEAGEADTAGRAHAQYYLELAERLDPGLRGANQCECLREFDDAYTNMRAALRWAAGSDTALALRMFGALSMYWWIRGARAQAASWGETVLNSLDGPPAGELVEDYLLCVFSASSDTADHRVLHAHLDTVNAVAARWNGPARRPLLPVLWARLVGAVREKENPLATPPETMLDHNAWHRALLPLSDGMRMLHTRRVVDAKSSLTDAERKFRDLGESWGLVRSLSELARISGWTGEYAGAMERLDEAVTLSDGLGSAEETAELLCQRAELHLWDAAVTAARDDCERALELAHRAGSTVRTARARAVLADALRRSGNLDAASTLCREALRACPASWFTSANARRTALVVLGRTLRDRGDHASARAYLTEALDPAHPADSATSAEALAVIAVAVGDDTRAARLLGAGAAVRGVPGTFDPETSAAAEAVRDRIGELSFDVAHDAGAHSGLAEARQG